MAEELTKEHVFVISEILIHIEDLQRRIATLFRELVTKPEPYKPMLRAMETIPGIDRMAAAMLLVEFGNDMTAFGTAEKLASWGGVCPGNRN